MILISQGVPQTFHGHATAHDARRARTQTIARGPVASQIAIKQLGTNGGGFYNSNSAVPFENPNGLTNFLEMLAILLIPAAQVFMFGKMVLARRQAWMVFAAMFVRVRDRRRRSRCPAEQHGSQVLRDSGREHHAGRAARAAATWPTRRSASASPTPRSGRRRRRDASNGSVNGGHDALTPAGGAVPLVNIFLGEVIFGGVGSGLYGMFFYIVIAVFVAGLMVGRTPEYLGKKIEAREIKSPRVGALFVPDDGAGPDRRSRSSTHAGPGLDLQPRRPRLHRGALRLRLAGEQQRQRVRRLRRDELLGRASARSRCTSAASCRCSPRSRSAARWPRRRSLPASAGTFRTDGPTFVVLLVGVIVLTAGLMIFPALTLGPIVEGLMH